MDVSDVSRGMVLLLTIPLITTLGKSGSVRRKTLNRIRIRRILKMETEKILKERKMELRQEGREGASRPGRLSGIQDALVFKFQLFIQYS